MKKIAPEEIKLLAQYIHNISGIFYDQKKAYLFETRLGPILEKHALSSYSELYHTARKNKIIEKNIINAISTNETLFFRDASLFELLKHKIMPELIDARSAKSSGMMPVSLKMWSAACSTGQEVYSIAIVLKELLPDLKKYRVKLLGTDISDLAVAQASHGKYNKFEIERGLEKKTSKIFFPKRKLLED